MFGQTDNATGSYALFLKIQLMQSKEYADRVSPCWCRRDVVGITMLINKRMGWCIVHCCSSVKHGASVAVKREQPTNGGHNVHAPHQRSVCSALGSSRRAHINNVCSPCGATQQYGTKSKLCDWLSVRCNDYYKTRRRSVELIPPQRPKTPTICHCVFSSICAIDVA